MDSTGKLLIKAAEEIEKRGWRQGTAAINTDGKLCAFEAIAWVDRKKLNEITEGTLGELALYRVCDLLRFRPNDSLGKWNDNPKRTAEEVIDVLIAAAYY